MQQQLMQMQPMMAAYASPNQVTTDIIQQYLDENKQLILAILDNQNAGKAEECAENQAKLQRNLMYLAAIADSQPQVPTIAQVNPSINCICQSQISFAQYSPNAVMQSGARYMQPQQAQPLTPQSIMAARSSMLYAQSPLSALQQQQQQQAALHGQIGLSSGSSNTGFNILHGENSVGGNSAMAMFPDFGRSSSSGKQEPGSGLSADGRGGNSAGQNSDGSDQLYMKGQGEEGN